MPIIFLLHFKGSGVANYRRTNTQESLKEVLSDDGVFDIKKAINCQRIKLCKQVQLVYAHDT